uniref:Uncharacterized protein n=1 Tax=Arundo donax TaxID=35708 RepID=A0A0A9EK64_ARUDO
MHGIYEDANIILCKALATTRNKLDITTRNKLDITTRNKLDIN